MKVGIIQSSFVPWRGFFDFIASVDLFIFYDDVQYTKRDWRNRNCIKTPYGTKWLTVPIVYHQREQLISETAISNTENWRQNHLNQWYQNYHNAPFYEDVINLLGDLGSGNASTISQLNIHLIKSICEYLKISTPTIMDSELNVEGAKTDRLINLLRAVDGKAYLSGPSAASYLEKQKFIDAGIGLEYKSYDYEPYPQLWGNFDGAVSVLDLIANCGQQSRERIRSATPDVVVIS